MDERKRKTPNELVNLKKKAKRSKPADGTIKPVPVVIETSSASLDISLHSEPSANFPVLTDIKMEGECTTDWCLKTKLRIISQKDFSWLSGCKAHQEAKALAEVNQSFAVSIKNIGDVLVLFYRSLVVWSHPYFPFIDLFPRIEGKLPSSSSTPMILGDKEMNLIKDNWSTSFHSAFQLLHTGHCPYFYVCANSVTILFLSANLVKPHGVALITPTTSGFRGSMRKQGIHYNLSLTKHQTSPLEERDNESVDDEWLKSMITNKSRLSGNVEIRPRESDSLVAVEGQEFNALVNFILNNKTLIVGDGRLAGIPPTLLAPKPFLGATMSSLKVKRCHIMDADKGGQLTGNYYMDIAGPIMPHNMQQITTALDCVQHYTIQTSLIETTTSFNKYFQSE